MSNEIPPLEIPAIAIRQRSWTFYVGVLSGKDLRHITTEDTLRLEDLDVPKYEGFNRPILKSRAKEIRDFYKEPRSLVPNSIILSLSSEYVRATPEPTPDGSPGRLLIDRVEEAATIVDGQHRVAGLKLLTAEEATFPLIVTIFVDLGIIDSAEVFRKVNSTQRKVNPSIAFQLFGYSEARSPQKTAHEIAKTLNTTPGSPFHHRIKMTGSKDESTDFATISQASFCRDLMRLYSKKPVEDENLILRGKPLRTDQSLPLRSLFIEENDGEILRIVWRFFDLVKKNWGAQWDDRSGSSILVKTTGIAAWMRVLAWTLQQYGPNGVSGPSLELASDLGRIQAAFDPGQRKSTPFTSELFPPGLAGSRKLEERILTVLRDT